MCFSILFSAHVLPLNNFWIPTRMKWDENCNQKEKAFNGNRLCWVQLGGNKSITLESDQIVQLS
jgi:hypothetical protein